MRWKEFMKCTSVHCNNNGQRRISLPDVDNSFDKCLDIWIRLHLKRKLIFIIWLKNFYLQNLHTQNVQFCSLVVRKRYETPHMDVIQYQLLMIWKLQINPLIWKRSIESEMPHSNYQVRRIKGILPFRFFSRCRCFVATVINQLIRFSSY